MKRAKIKLIFLTIIILVSVVVAGCEVLERDKIARDTKKELKEYYTDAEILESLFECEDIKLFGIQRLQYKLKDAPDYRDYYYMVHKFWYTGTDSSRNEISGAAETIIVVNVDGDVYSYDISTTRTGDLKLARQAYLTFISSVLFFIFIFGSIGSFVFFGSPPQKMEGHFMTLLIFGGIFLLIILGISAGMNFVGGWPVVIAIVSGMIFNFQFLRIGSALDQLP